MQDLSAYVRALRFGRRLRTRGKAWHLLALRSFAEARKLRRNDVEPIIEIARTYDLMANPFTARRWYRRALRRGRDCIEAWVEGARTYAKGQDFHRARWLHGAVALRPDDNELNEEFGHHLERLSGWQRWWVEHRFWRHRRAALEASKHQIC